jgi:hypothetical protein
VICVTCGGGAANVTGIGFSLVQLLVK